MSANTYAFLALFVLSAALAVGLFFPLRGALQGLLQRTVRLPDGVTFYLRSLFPDLLLGPGRSAGIYFRPQAGFALHGIRLEGGFRVIERA